MNLTGIETQPTASNFTKSGIKAYIQVFLIVFSVFLLNVLLSILHVRGPEASDKTACNAI
jgi:hypothetical protein